MNSRITMDDINTFLAYVNAAINNPNKTIIARRHEYNSNIGLMIDDGSKEYMPFYFGNKREVYTYLRAMLKMHEMTKES